MYKYTIRKEVLQFYRRSKHKEFCSEQYKWYLFINTHYPLELYDSTRVDWLSGYLAWYFPQSFVYYSVERRKYLTILGYKVVINPQLFLEEQV